MALDEQSRAYLERQQALGARPWHELTPAEARAYHFSRRFDGGMPEPVSKIEDHEIAVPGGHIRVRTYTPSGEAPFPVLVYLHGGGWVIGSIEIQEMSCTKLANASGCLIASVEYRLSPEHHFPIPAEDCYAAARWISEHIADYGGDPTRLAIGGDSAGGNLAAVVALMARDRGGPKFDFQLLIYPVTDYYLPGTPSYQAYAEGYGLSRADMIWFWHHYLEKESESKDAYASPLQAQDLSNLPPALIITAEYDPLRDEAELFARRLLEAHVPVVLKRYEGTIHGFFNLPNILDQGAVAYRDVATALRQALGVPGSR